MISWKNVELLLRRIELILGFRSGSSRYIEDIKCIMSGHEDVFYEIYQEVHSRGEEEVFYKQLEKMRYQDKHRHKCVKDHWEYAFRKINAAVGVPQENESFSKK